MITRPNKEEVENYFTHPAMNQSRLKLLAKGVNVFNATQDETDAEVMFYEEKTHFILGHAAELKLQNGVEEFNNTYHMSNVKKPSDTLMSIAQQVFDIQSRTKEPDESFQLLNGGDNIDTTADAIEHTIIDAISFHNYQPNWKMDTKVAKIITECNNYYNDLIASYGKQILDLNEISVINAIVQSLQENERTSLFFHDFREGSPIDYYYQLPIYFIYLGVEFKILIDILEVNHALRTLRVIDIKTLGDYCINFPKSVRQFRYDFQVAFYTLGVNKWKKTNSLQDYKILNPAFIVETTKPGKQGNPLIFECSESLLDIALYGRRLYQLSQHTDHDGATRETPIQTNKIYGIMEIVNLYKWHLENGFEVDKPVREADVKRQALTLNWEGI